MELTRKPVRELIKGKYTFFIPDYQRGYKWTRDEVIKLLNDIWDFALNRQKGEDDFYCLQPVVVKPQDDKYYVIDGQQRLTTLLIIQQAIQDYQTLMNGNIINIIESNPDWADTIFGSVKNTYTIEYATRDKSDVWLPKRRNIGEMQKNSDYFHIHMAYNAAIDFLKWIDGNTSDDFELEGKTCPTSKKKTNAYSDFDTCLKDKCNVIWYELDENNEKDHEIFDRLNTGKIPLTNAELIKAMFLQENNFPSISDETLIKSEDYRTSIARQWDDIERRLQDSVFWNFIYDSNTVGMTYDTRIEYLFDLLSNKEKQNIDRFYFTFDHYDALYQQYKEDGKQPIDFVNAEWKRVIELVDTLQDWYDDKTYYHYIGYLVTQGKSINEIKNMQFPVDEAGNNLPIPKKKDFVKSLEDAIRANTRRYTQSDLMKSKSGLTPTLLLFNILCVLDNSDDTARFPFNYYKSTEWNEEHVAPNTPFDPNNAKRCFQFAAQMLEYYTDISYYEQLDIKCAENQNLPKNQRKKIAVIENETANLLLPKFEKAIENLTEAKDICNNLLEIFKAQGKNKNEISQETFATISRSFNLQEVTLDEDDSRRDFIWNQVLLDAGTNKSYGNAIFPYKRMRIIKNVTKGIFVPDGTYNVFVKAYSHRMTNMLEWEETDAIRYLAEIYKVLRRKGRNFLNEELLSVGNLPDYVDINKLNNLIGDEQ